MQVWSDVDNAVSELLVGSIVLTSVPLFRCGVKLMPLRGCSV